MGCDDATANRVSRLILYILGVMHATPIMSAAEVIDVNIHAYALAAGSLAGIYGLPVRDLAGFDGMSEEEFDRAFRTAFGNNGESGQV
jgi:hypothetical protein